MRGSTLRAEFERILFDFKGLVYGESSQNEQEATKRKRQSCTGVVSWVSNSANVEAWVAVNNAVCPQSKRLWFGDVVAANVEV